MVQAIIQPFKLEEVKQALDRIEVRGITVAEIRGFGQQKGRTIEYRGAISVPEFIPKLKLEIVVTDPKVPLVEEALARAARTGNVEDGIILVLPLDSVSRIRTGETGDSAV